MPSAKSTSFKSGGGGFLRKKDGTLLDLTFEARVTGSGFNGVFAQLSIAEDGREDLIERSLLVGSAEDFGITDDGKGITGTTDIPGNLPWGIFATSIGKTDFDESVYDDSDPTVADYSPLIGGRFKFDWVVDERRNEKDGKRKVEVKDRKTGKKVTREYDNENLIVTAYYGQVEVEETPAPKKGATKGAVKGAGKPAPKAKSAPVADTDPDTLASDKILELVIAAGGKPVTKSRLGSLLLLALKDVDRAVRDAARAWALDNDNLASIPGIEFDAAKQTLTVAG